MYSYGPYLYLRAPEHMSIVLTAGAQMVTVTVTGMQRRLNLLSPTNATILPFFVLPSLRKRCVRQAHAQPAGRDAIA